MSFQSGGEATWKVWYAKHKNTVWRVGVIVVFLLLALWAFTLAYLEEYRGIELVIANSTLGLWLTVGLESVGPELAGIVIGVVIIDYLNERRQREQFKAQLIRQMGSSIRDVAAEAVRELAYQGWLYDGSLRDADLTGAALSESNLYKADLRRVNLSGADLTGSLLWEADLSEAQMWMTDLTGAFVRDTDLFEAQLSRANLAGVIKWTVRQLEIAKSVEGATMPDGVQIFAERTDGGLPRIEGSTFEDWKTAYLGKYGGDEHTVRDVERHEEAGQSDQR